MYYYTGTKKDRECVKEAQENRLKLFEKMEILDKKMFLDASYKKFKVI